MIIKQNLVAKSKYGIKCPYDMVPEYITVHNTANDASAEKEIAYMIGNSKEVSFHIAVDDKEIVQGIPLDRNAWHAGDGANGTGNRKSVAVEICYSKSGGARFDAAEKNAAKWIADELKKRGWGIDRVKRHKDWSGKNCPHRTMARGWTRFLNMVKSYMQTAPGKPITAKSIEEIAKEVIAGKWGNGATRAAALSKAGYNASAVQKKVNELLGGAKTVTSKKSIDAIAREVIAGKWGNGSTRKKKLAAAGYSYAAVQKKVNQLIK